MADQEDVWLALTNMRETVAEALERFTAEPEPGKRRRLTKDEVFAAMLANAGRHGGERSSVTLKSNAKGETQIEVTVRTGDTSEIATAAEAMAEATRLYLNARETFGLAGIPVAAAAADDDGRQA